MSVADSDIDVLRGKGGIPTSPFEIQITKEAIQRRLDNGECQVDCLATRFENVAGGECIYGGGRKCTRLGRGEANAACARPRASFIYAADIAAEE